VLLTRACFVRVGNEPQTIRPRIGAHFYCQRLARAAPRIQHRQAAGAGEAAIVLATHIPKSGERGYRDKEKDRGDNHRMVGHRVAWTVAA
jgi:hypothetical protein